MINRIASKIPNDRVGLDVIEKNFTEYIKNSLGDHFLNEFHESTNEVKECFINDLFYAWQDLKKNADVNNKASMILVRGPM